jgi:hypothetical protein
MAMMTVSEVVSQLLGSDRIAEMAERVAGRSRMGVWQRVMNRLGSLGPTEARGYLRARGIAVVREETSRLIEQEGTAVAGRRTEIEDTAMQLMINMISSQMSQRTVSTGGRKAA